MSTTLEVALISASMAIVVLVISLVLMMIFALRQLKVVTQTIEGMKASLENLINDSHELVENVKQLTVHINMYLDNVDQVVRTVKNWTARADHLVNEVGSAIEPPVFSFVRNVKMIQSVVSTFLQRFLHPMQEPQTNNPTRKEIDHDGPSR